MVTQPTHLLTLIRRCTLLQAVLLVVPVERLHYPRKVLSLFLTRMQFELGSTLNRLTLLALTLQPVQVKRPPPGLCTPSTSIHRLPTKRMMGRADRLLMLSFEWRITLRKVVLPTW